MECCPWNGSVAQAKQQQKYHLQWDVQGTFTEKSVTMMHLGLSWLGCGFWVSLGFSLGVVSWSPSQIPLFTTTGHFCPINFKASALAVFGSSSWWPVKLSLHSMDWPRHGVQADWARGGELDRQHALTSTAPSCKFNCAPLDFGLIFHQYFASVVL